MSTHPALIVKLLPAFALGCLITTPALADTFGSGANTFNIDFVPIGNVGNGDDLGAGGGIYSSPYGGVAYDFRMGVTEASQDWITKATASGLVNVTAGAWTGSQPAANMTWFEAAAFVNFLNTSTGHQAAYQLNPTNTALTLWSSGDAWQAGGENLYRHKDAYYFLPSEDEWYKSAYHKNDGATANYWDYATGSNSIPDGLDFNGDPVFDAVFSEIINASNQNHPNGVTNAGVVSPYGTFGQNGNVFEWEESAFDGVNDSSTENRVARGGAWVASDDVLRASSRGTGVPAAEFNAIGFRVASIPEPSSTMLMLSAGLAGWLGKRRTVRR